MLLRELSIKDPFSVFWANVQVKHEFYSQWIPVQISARSIHDARKIIQGQYGADSSISGLRKSK